MFGGDEAGAACSSALSEKDAKANVLDTLMEFRFVLTAICFQLARAESQMFMLLQTQFFEINVESTVPVPSAQTVLCGSSVLLT